MTGLFEVIKTVAQRSRQRVGIGILAESASLVASLQDAAAFADVVTVGKPVFGCVNIGIGDEQEISDTLVSMAKEKTVDAIVRGQIYYSKYHKSLKQVFGFKGDLMCPCLIKDHCGNEWFLTPVVHHDDCSVVGRCYLATQAAKICAKLGIEPVIGILAADLESERGYSDLVDASLDDAKKIVDRIKEAGYQCKMYPLRIDLAAKECNIVVPMDGIVGNFVCRALIGLGGASMVGGFSLTNRLVSLDTSRQNDQFTMSIAAAAAMCNLGGMPVAEYHEDAPP